MIRTLTIAATLGVALNVGAQNDAVDAPAESSLLSQREMTVAESPQPEIGFRFAKLTAAQQRALRPRFRLPMEVLFQASSPSDLRAAAEVQPVPDPHRPLLPVKDDGSSGNPFAESQTDVSKFDVLNKLFAAEIAAASAAGEEPGDLSASSGLDDAFVADDAFAPTAEADDASADAPVEEFDDPFADF